MEQALPQNPPNDGNAPRVQVLYATARVLSDSVFALLVWWVGVSIYTFLPTNSPDRARHAEYFELALAGGVLFILVAILLSFGLWGYAIIPGFCYCVATGIFLDDGRSPVIKKLLTVFGLIAFVVGWWFLYPLDYIVRPSWWIISKEELMQELCYCAVGGVLFGLMVGALFLSAWFELLLVPAYFWSIWEFIMRDCDEFAP